jgi:hypothetical protein
MDLTFFNLDTVGYGTIAAILVRWLLGVDVGLHWTLFAGAITAVVQPFMTYYLGPVTPLILIPELVSIAIVPTAMLGAILVIRGY